MQLTISDIANILDSIGYPVAYHHFKQKTKAPYVIYYNPVSDGFGADNKNYFNVNSVHIELYTLKKDKISEEKIEGLLNENNIFWERSEVYIDSEDLYRVLYEIEI